MYTANKISVILLSMPGGIEWILILLAIVLLFGAKKIPELARGLGKGVRDFKDAREGSTEASDETPEDNKKK